MTQGPAAAGRYLAPAAAPLEQQLPKGPLQAPATVRRLLRTGVSLDCGQTQILQTGRRSEQCVSYGDGSRVFLWRIGERWFVAGFTLG